MKDESDSVAFPVCLTIAGVDPSGGAGVIADIKTFAAHRCYGAAAIASLTFQNTVGVFGAVNQTAETVRDQIIPVLDDLPVAAVKTGMLPTREIIEEVARIASERTLPNLVVDPVVRATSGFDLIDDAALRSLIEQLFPISDVITPNLPEAERIAGMKISTEDDIRRAADVMRSQGARRVLIKGGHLPVGIENDSAKSKRAIDFLFIDGQEHRFEAEFYETTATHGTGCTFAAAIAANLAKGQELVEAVDLAKKYVNAAIRTAPKLGHGHSPVNHFVKV